MQRISVFGLGKIGHVLATCLAHAGHQVVGVDTNVTIVDKVNNGTLDSIEPGVLARFKKVHNKRLRATADSEEAVRESDISCLILPTPSNQMGGFSLRYILNACQIIGHALRKKNTYHLVLVISTMIPGSSEYIVVPHLEKASGRHVGKDFGYCYNPFFIALGEVVKGLVEPDYVLVGASDGRAANLTATMHEPMVKLHTPIIRMSPTEAEVTKIASNTHETMRVSFANMLCALCSEIPGTNVDTVTQALAYRMGKRFFKGATPYGGPCWPRDNIALAAFMDTLRLSSIMPQTIDRYNSQHAMFIYQKLKKIIKKGNSISLLGIAYKPGTSVVERSFGIDMAERLVKDGYKVFVWDTLAMSEARKQLGDSVGYTPSGNECLDHGDVVVIINAMVELESLDWTLVRNRPVLDCWRCMSSRQKAKLNQYFPLGSSHSQIPMMLKKNSLQQLRNLTK